ncbi:MAG: glycosyltransferase family 9 protein [Acidihalobacter sp.]
MSGKTPRILVIRRDNIGDLVCTLPLIAALRQRFPDAYLAALVNSYNRDVLQGNPDLDEVFAYTKAKHREPDETVLGVHWRRLMLFRHLRKLRFDYVVLGGAHFLPRALQLARPLRARHIVGFTEPDRRGVQHIDTGVPYGSGDGLHEVEDIFRLAAPFGIEGEAPPARVVAEESLRQTFAAQLPPDFAGHLLVGLHVSARKPSNRWPAERFIELAHGLHERHGARFLLFWSPGAADDRFHPGDDDKALAIAEALGPELLNPVRTTQLGELIAGLSLCDAVVCSDGGAMHIAAALEKPIVCLFGGTDPVRWHPWRVPHILLQEATRDVSDIRVDALSDAFDVLMEQASANNKTI